MLTFNNCSTVEAYRQFCRLGCSCCSVIFFVRSWVFLLRTVTSTSAKRPVYSYLQASLWLKTVCAFFARFSLSFFTGGGIQTPCKDFYHQKTDFLFVKSSWVSPIKVKQTTSLRLVKLKFVHICRGSGPSSPPPSSHIADKHTACVYRSWPDKIFD